MCAGVVDEEVVALLELRKRTVDGELVVVLAERAGHVIGVVTWRVLLPEDGDVVVSAVHRRAHEVDRTGIDTGILLIGMLEVNDLRDQCAVWCQHEAAHLGEDADVAEAVRHEHFIKYAMNALADRLDVVRLLVRLVWHADTAGEVDEVERDAGLCLDLDGELEELLRKGRVVIVRYRVRGEEGVHAEVLDATLFQDTVALDELCGGHAVLRILRVIHDGVCDAEVSARIIAKAHGLREAAQGILQLLDVREVVEVDDGTELVRELILLEWCVVRGKHDVVAVEAAGVGHLKLGEGAAVRAAALFLQNTKDGRVRGRLHREILLEALIPAEGLIYLPRILTNALLVVQIERCRVGLRNFLHLVQCDIWCFHGFLHVRKI